MAARCSLRGQQLRVLMTQRILCLRQQLLLFLEASHDLNRELCSYAPGSGRLGQARVDWDRLG